MMLCTWDTTAYSAVAVLRDTCVMLVRPLRDRAAMLPVHPLLARHGTIQSLLENRQCHKRCAPRLTQHVNLRPFKSISVTTPRGSAAILRSLQSHSRLLGEGLQVLDFVFGAHEKGHALMHRLRVDVHDTHLAC